MVRECRGITEIAVMEMPQLGVKTRTRARATATATATAGTEMIKKRKLSDGEMRISASYIQLRSGRITLQNSNSKQEGGNISGSNNTLSPSSDHDDRVSASCCSSNGSSQEVNERIKFIDLEDENVEGEVETSTYYSWREERRETTPLSEFRDESYDLDSTTNPSTEANSRLGGSTVEKKKKKMMPTESELEEFFAAAEKNLQKQFTDKYNYDIVKDEPIEGSYEWVRLRP